LPPLAERQRTAKTKRIDGDNLDTFNTRYKVATNKGLPHDQAMVEAARKTKTGEWARAAGFNNINSRKQRARPAHTQTWRWNSPSKSDAAVRHNIREGSASKRDVVCAVPSRIVAAHCACGGTAGPTGECEQCSKKRKSTTDRPIRGVPTWDVNKALEGRVGTTGSFRGNLMHGEGEYAIPARVPPENIRR
jgi:hypothetical protein